MIGVATGLLCTLLCMLLVAAVIEVALGLAGVVIALIVGWLGRSRDG